MGTEYFVDKQSVVRKIWGKSDTILFFFAGTSAEFALNKAVEWLYGPPVVIPTWRMGGILIPHFNRDAPFPGMTSF